MQSILIDWSVYEVIPLSMSKYLRGKNQLQRRKLIYSTDCMSRTVAEIRSISFKKKIPCFSQKDKRLFFQITN